MKHWGLTLIDGWNSECKSITDNRSITVWTVMVSDKTFKSATVWNWFSDWWQLHFNNKISILKYSQFLSQNRSRITTSINWTGAFISQLCFNSVLLFLVQKFRNIKLIHLHLQLEIFSLSRYFAKCPKMEKILSQVPKVPQSLCWSLRFRGKRWKLAKRWEFFSLQFWN